MSLLSRTSAMVSLLVVSLLGALQLSPGQVKADKTFSLLSTNKWTGGVCPANLQPKVTFGGVHLMNNTASLIPIARTETTAIFNETELTVRLDCSGNGGLVQWDMILDDNRTWKRTNHPDVYSFGFDNFYDVSTYKTLHSWWVDVHSPLEFDDLNLNSLKFTCQLLSLEDCRINRITTLSFKGSNFTHTKVSVVTIDADVASIQQDLEADTKCDLVHHIHWTSPVDYQWFCTQNKVHHIKNSHGKSCGWFPECVFDYTQARQRKPCIENVMQCDHSCLSVAERNGTTLLLCPSKDDNDDRSVKAMAVIRFSVELYDGLPRHYMSSQEEMPLEENIRLEEIPSILHLHDQIQLTGYYARDLNWLQFRFAYETLDTNITGKYDVLPSNPDNSWDDRNEKVGRVTATLNVTEDLARITKIHFLGSIWNFTSRNQMGKSVNVDFIKERRSNGCNITADNPIVTVHPRNESLTVSSSQNIIVVQNRNVTLEFKCQFPYMLLQWEYPENSGFSGNNGSASVTFSSARMDENKIIRFRCRATNDSCKSTGVSLKKHSSHDYVVIQQFRPAFDAKDVGIELTTPTSNRISNGSNSNCQKLSPFVTALIMYFISIILLHQP